MERGEVLGGQYRLDQRLGQGGMGEVWQGTDLRLDRPVAVKVVLAHLGSELNLVGRLLREARAAGALQHPSITVVHNVGEHDGRPFFVMELLKGEDLARVLRRHPTGLAVDLVLSIAEQAADALSSAHDQGIVHRDIKPANLMLLGDDRIKICDFGISKLADATTGLSHGAIIGSPTYMSPEQFRGAELDGRSDLYSLGCTIYALLASAPPFRSDQAPMAVAYQHLSEPPPAVRETRPDVPPDLERLVIELLAKDPADRPASAAAVRDRLRALRTTPASHPSGTLESTDLLLPATTPRLAETRQLTPAPKAARPTDRRSHLVIHLVVLALLGAAFLYDVVQAEMWDRAPSLAAIVLLAYVGSRIPKMTAFAALGVLSASVTLTELGLWPTRAYTYAAGVYLSEVVAGAVLMVLTAIVVWQHRPSIAAGTVIAVALSGIVVVGVRWEWEFRSDLGRSGVGRQRGTGLGGGACRPVRAVTAPGPAFGSGGQAIAVPCAAWWVGRGG